MPINKDSRHCVRVTVTTRLWFRRLRHPRTLVETVSLPHASSALSLAKPEWQIHACILLLSKTSTRYCACIVSTFWKPEWQIHACILRLSKTSTRYCPCLHCQLFLSNPQRQIYTVNVNVWSKTSTRYCGCIVSTFWKPEWQIYACILLLSKTSTNYYTLPCLHALPALSLEAVRSNLDIIIINKYVKMFLLSKPRTRYCACMHCQPYVLKAGLSDLHLYTSVK